MSKLLKIKTLSGVDIPAYETNGASGFDLKAHSFKKLFKGSKEVSLDEKMQESIKEGYITLRGFERVLIGTGLFVEVTEGYEIQLRSRSGNTLKKGLVVANGIGTIDSDYRGELGVILINNTPFLSEVKLGERIAQGVLVKIDRAVWQATEVLEASDRGEGGFGSTGE